MALTQRLVQLPSNKMCIRDRAKVIPGKKVVTGPAYLVMEDVPIYFLGIPEGFFPISSGPKSGLLMPTYGEEYTLSLIHI